MTTICLIMFYINFFQDLVQLVNAEQPFWLTGLTEMTRTFGLELLELIFTSFPDIFYKVLSIFKFFRFCFDFNIDFIFKNCLKARRV